MWGDQDELGPLESDIFTHCYNVGPPPMMPPRAPKRQRPERQFQGPSHYQSQLPHPPPYANRGQGQMRMYQMPPERDPVRLISRILLQQEETICHLRHEKCFVMFMKHDQEGILRQLMMVAKEWNDKKAKTPEQLESALRTLLLQSMLQELLNRVQKESATEEGRTRLVQKGWLTPEHHWAYLRWDRQA